MPYVISSAIRAVDYDGKRSRLLVVFRESGRYAYLNVPKGVYDAFLAAESKGSFFNEEIRDRYRYVRHPQH